MGHGLMQFYAQLGLTNTVSHRLKFRNKDLSLKSEVGVFLCYFAEIATLWLMQLQA